MTADFGMPLAAIEQAGALLLEATRSRRRVELPEELKPRNEAQAVAIRNAQMRLAGVRVGGWKVGAADPAARQKMGLADPFTGMIPADCVVRSPATFRWDELLRPIVESEYAFRLGRDIRPRREPYSRAEVEDAVAALIIGVEVPESRIADGHGLGALAMVADQGGVGRYVVGPEFTDWRGIDLLNQEVIQLIDGKEVGRGTGRGVMGDPVDCLTWFVNHMSAHDETLAAGIFVSTGSCTGVVPVPGAARCVSDFGPLGRVEVEFT